MQTGVSTGEFCCNHAGETGVFDPRTISGLALWLDGDDGSKIVESSGRVSQWSDKSGNDNHTTAQATREPQTGIRTLLGRNGITFNETGNAEFLDLTSDIINSENSMFVVAQMEASNGVFVGDNPNSRFGYYGNELRSKDDSNNELLAGAIDQGRPYLFRFEHNTGVTSISLNRAEVDSDTFNGNFTISMIGSFAAANNVNNMHGTIFEVLIYDRQLTVEETENVEDYLDQKYFTYKEYNHYDPAYVVGPGGDYSSLKTALSDIGPGTETKTNFFFVRNGTYEEMSTNVPAYCYVRGQSQYGVVLLGEYADDHDITDINSDSPVDFNRSGIMENITVSGKNCRYGVHMEAWKSTAQVNATVRDLAMIHQGNAGAEAHHGAGSTWQNPYVLGTGLNSGESLIVCNCTLVHEEGFGCFSTHSNQDHSAPVRVIMENCALIMGDSASESAHAVRIQSAASQQVDQFIMCTCTRDKGMIYYTQSNLKPTSPAVAFAKGDFEILIYDTDIGYYGNDPSTGDDNFKQRAIRFDTIANADEMIAVSGDGADAFMGSNVTAKALGSGMPSYAYGALDTSGLYITGTRIGERLGDCSTTTKMLTVGTDTITLDLDYSAMSTTSVLADINGKLTHYVASQYIVMNDYRPFIENYETLWKNTTGNSVGIGDMVTLLSGKVGIALEDIKAGETGRVQYRGEVTQFTVTAASLAALPAANTEIVVVAT